jgi:O-antigen/teichoic acid export membrane protein
VAADPRGAPVDEPRTREPSHFISLAKQTLIYGLSGVAIQAVGVITLPIWGHVFTPSEFGVLELATTVSAVALALIDAGFASAAQRSFYDYSDDEHAARGRVLFTAIAFTTTLAVLIALALALGRSPTSDWLLDGRGQGVLLAVAVSLPLVNAASFMRETMRLRFRAWHYVVSSILAAVVAAGVGIVAVVSFDRGAEGVFIGVIVGNALAALYGLSVVRGDLGTRPSGPELRKMLAYGLPLVPAGLAMWALALVDRIMLNKLGTLADVGQYAVANRIASVLLLGITGFVLAFGPYVFSIYSQDRELEKLVRGKTLTFLTVCLCAAALALTLFAREIISVVAPAFDSAYEAVGLLMLSVVAFGISTVVMAGISIMRRTKVLAVLAVTAAIVNIALNFALIPPFGMVGAAAATAIAFLVLAALHYRVAQMYYPTPYEPAKVLTAVALATFFGTLGLLPLDLLLAVPVKVAGLAAFLLLLRATGVVDATELERLRTLISGMIRFRSAQP